MRTWWIWIAAALLGCGSAGPQGTGGGAGADAGVDAGGDGTDAGTGGLAGDDAGVHATAGAGRSDPEGVAPPSATVTNLTWKDSRGAGRTLVLGAYLYQYDFSFTGGAPDPAQVIARSAGDDAYGHPGFGYVVSHNTQTGNSPLGKANAPLRVQTTVLQGGHHALHRVELVYDRDKEGGGNGIRIPVVIDWFVATGRDHPVWSVTWRAGAAENPNGVDFDAYRMDTRGPYGSLNWDGAATKAAGDAIGGVSWGDYGLLFATGGAQLTLQSPWTYDTPNAVPFTRAWAASVNAEMGIVRTLPGDKTMGYPDRVYGRERGSTSALAYPDKGDCTALSDARAYAVPCVGGWPYQLMNFDWDPTSGKPADEATGTKLIAWGSPYGWLGASAFDLFDYAGTADGRGDRSYATFIVLGPKCRYQGGAGCDGAGDVAATVAAVEALAAAALTVSAGSVVTAVPRGPGATQTKSIAGGYDDTYAVHTLAAAGNRVAFTFAPAAGKPVKNPIFRIQGYTAGAAPIVTVDGSAVAVNAGAASSGAFVSLDGAAGELWVTLNRTVTSAAAIAVGPP